MRSILLGLVATAILAPASSSLFAGTPLPPYEPVAASHDTFRCLGRDVSLGSMLLPRQIISASGELLAEPVRLVADPGLLSDLEGNATLTTSGESRSEWEWKGESRAFRVLSTMKADCDGFCWYQISLEPKQETTVSSLRLEIPRLRDTARYIHRTNYTWGDFSYGHEQAGGKWSGSFMPYVWLGDEG